MPASSSGAWLREVREHPAALTLRSDAHARLVAVARVLACSADWQTLTSRPTWSRLCEQTGQGRSTVARWLAWLRSAGLLGVVETGSTPQLRPMALAHVEGNRAALYVLAVEPTPEPAPDMPSGDDAPGPLGSSLEDVSPTAETGTPSWLTVGELPTHARGAAGTSPLRGPDRREAARSTWGWCQPTTHGRARLGCAARLRERVPALRPLSDRHLRHLLRPWLEAGWTAADVARAIDYAPDGTAHTWTTAVRSPKGWLRARLGLWTDATGAPLPPLSAARAAAVEARRVEQAAARQRAAEQRRQVETEHELRDRLRQVAGATWDQLLVRFARGRRAPGPMSAALAGAAVRSQLEHLGEDMTAADDEQLRAAVEAALRAEVAA